jgi:hypothetical protein
MRVASRAMLYPMRVQGRLTIRGERRSISDYIDRPNRAHARSAATSKLLVQRRLLSCPAPITGGVRLREVWFPEVTIRWAGGMRRQG